MATTPADPECANPLLLRWIGEWLEEARHRNSMGITTYKKAYDSMKACPLRFNHPSEAQQLHGLGPRLCDRLTAKLVEHCRETGRPMPKRSSAASKRPLQDDEESAPPKKGRKPRPYVPTFRTGPYAILLALSSGEDGSTQGLTKVEIIELAQPDCDSSFTAPSDPTKFFTAWNSMKTLIGKDLVFERGRPLRKYALTDDGWDVARRVRRPNVVDPPAGPTAIAESGHKACDPDASTLIPTSTNKEQSTGDFQDTTRLSTTQSRRDRNRNWDWVWEDVEEDIGDGADGFDAATSDPARYRCSPPGTEPDGSARPAVAAPRQGLKGVDRLGLGAGRTGETTSRASADQATFPPAFDPLVLEPSTFTIHLVLDNREVRAKEDRTYIQDELTRRGVRPIMRSLDVGDALWIARRQGGNGADMTGSEQDDIVLDWIVERKRLDDLVGSIKDGRFREQKFRLRRSGVKNVIYLIEEISMTTESFSKYQEATESAIASSQVVDGFFVKRTQKIDDTIRYLARMTILLKSVYESNPLHVIPSRVLSPDNYLPLLTHLRSTKPSIDYHITYEAFANLASKSDFLTLRDVYLKMLMCTKGITGEKALEIQKRWATPNHLIRAYDRCGHDEAANSKRMNLIATELVGTVGRKSIGKALSAKVADVWGSL